MAYVRTQGLCGVVPCLMNSLMAKTMFCLMNVSTDAALLSSLACNALSGVYQTPSQIRGKRLLSRCHTVDGETGKALALSLSFCCFAGLVAGLLGLGGGMIIGPLLMGLKVHPQ
eukprot:728124-Pelagomonas_calceolata.AAC.4